MVLFVLSFGRRGEEREEREEGKRRGLLSSLLQDLSTCQESRRSAYQCAIRSNTLSI
jgi:hypothetical protein